jgi:ADP-ribose pyrophosphatase YjhB (NUDIX family)
MEVKFCRRCAAPLTQDGPTRYTCANGHVLFYSSQAAIGLFIVNDKSEVLLVTRAHEPRKGMLDTPGGFCDAEESLEDTTARELQEELHLAPDAYTTPQFLSSGINHYQYGGEDIRPLDVFFWAKAKGELKPQADDDAESFGWYPLAQLNPENMAFVTQQKALSMLKAALDVEDKFI